jgi:hypothetical protein
MAFVSPLITRQVCLWQIPDVELPFNVEDVVREEVPAEEDAFVIYGNVLKLLASGESVSVNQDRFTFDNSGLSLEDVAKVMSAHNPEALAEYLRAGEMKRAGGPSLKTATFSVSLSLHQEMRKLARTYNALGVAFEQTGNIEKAWACHRANLQCSIHTEQPGFAICALIGVALRNVSVEGISHWAGNSAVTAERLRTARTEIAREYARRITLFDIAKAEYLSARNTLSTGEAASFQLPIPEGNPSVAAPLIFAKRVVLWCIGQPELALRLSRQLLLNNATEIDKPLHDRRHSILLKDAGQVIFDRDPNTPRIARQLDPKQLVQVLENKSPLTHVQNALLVALCQMDEARRRDNARLATLTSLFAVQEYQRIHGHFPDTLDLLVPSILDEIPLDPCDVGGAAVNYRRDADCTAFVWSIGPNGIDDQGTFDKTLDIGFKIELNPDVRGK